MVFLDLSLLQDLLVHTLSCVSLLSYLPHKNFMSQEGIPMSLPSMHPWQETGQAIIHHWVTAGHLVLSGDNFGWHN